MLATLDDVIRAATSALEDFEYTTALERIERFFWSFCDDYVELVKDRAYDGVSGDPQSARLALRTALSTLLRLLAPFLPYTTEEAWSWWHTDSVHTSPWPTPRGPVDETGSELINLASIAIRAIRKAKTDAKRSMRAVVEAVHISVPDLQRWAVDAMSADLRAAGNVATYNIATSPGHELRIEVTLAEE